MRPGNKKLLGASMTWALMNQRHENVNIKPIAQPTYFKHNISQWNFKTLSAISPLLTSLAQQPLLSKANISSKNLKRGLVWPRRGSLHLRDVFPKAEPRGKSLRSLLLKSATSTSSTHLIVPTSPLHPCKTNNRRSSILSKTSYITVEPPTVTSLGRSSSSTGCANSSLIRYMDWCFLGTFSSYPRLW